jgi:hypothetical protein
MVLIFFAESEHDRPLASTRVIVGVNMS